MRALIIFFSLILVNSVYAYTSDIAKLQIKIADPVKNNSYFLCVDTGCYSIEAAKTGKVFLMNSGKVNDILMADVSRDQLVGQPMPASCHVKVNPGQVLTVSGRIAVKNAHAYLVELHCSVD